MDAHLRDLRYFVAVAEELSFTRAAERLFLSQPALSKQIRQLEEGLRVRLFERDHRSISLTGPGEALLERARDLLARWDETQRAVSDAAAVAASVLTVGLSTSVGRGLLAATRTEFLQRRPTWRTQMRHVGWDDATAGLASGDVDVAFLWLPFPGQDSFCLQVVAREPRWVAFPEDHWLAGREEVAFADLLDEPFLALPESTGPLRDFWLATGERGGRPARIGAVVANPEETFSAVEEGSGVVLLASGNADIYRRPGVGAVPVTGLSPCELALTWRKDDHRVAVRDFVDAVRRATARPEDRPGR